MKVWLRGASCRPDERVWSTHNIMMRAVVTTCYMILITFIACLIPFFGCALSVDVPCLSCVITSTLPVTRQRYRVRWSWLQLLLETFHEHMPWMAICCIVLIICHRDSLQCPAPFPSKCSSLPC